MAKGKQEIEGVSKGIDEGVQICGTKSLRDVIRCTEAAIGVLSHAKNNSHVTEATNNPAPSNSKHQDVTPESSSIPPVMTTRLYMLVDIEALVMHPMSQWTPVVEKAAYLIIDANCNHVYSAQMNILQPCDVNAIMAQLKREDTMMADMTPEKAEIRMWNLRQTVDTAIRNYVNCTYDETYIHEGSDAIPWTIARAHIIDMSRKFATAIYVKGAALENRLFAGDLRLVDLNWYGCPRYPYKPHEPLAECRFFANFVPLLDNAEYHRSMAVASYPPTPAMSLYGIRQNW
jgi:hypothetical protein